MTVQVRRKGIITLPARLRRQYGLVEGDVFTLFDLGDGALMMIPGVSQVSCLGDQVSRMVADENVTLEEMLEVLEQERESSYREHYADA